MPVKLRMHDTLVDGKLIVYNYLWKPKPSSQFF